MLNAYDIAYGLGVGLSAPFWLALPASRRKVLKAFRERMGHVEPADETPSAPGVMIHAVSLGEMNATRALVAKLREARPGLRFILSTTTDTGYARGRELYGSATDCQVIRYPLDFSLAVERALDGVRPSLVVLMELEVWPNFLRQCGLRGIPVLLVNGRLTGSSFRNYRIAGPVTQSMFGRLALVCAQERAYADRFVALGASRERVRVTGTMKFDNAQTAGAVEGADDVARAVGMRPGTEKIWVCGSTGPGEEGHVLDAYETLLKQHPGLRLVIVPRHPQRFDEVAAKIASFGFPVVRRSNPQLLTDDSSSPPPVILGDTMGELRKFYSLADVVLVGRSLVDLGARQHGSDMIEPAALAKPVVVGPYTGNFAEVMHAFLAADAMVQIRDPDDLADTIGGFLAVPDGAAAMGRRAQDVVRREQGATDRHVQVILEHLPRAST
jgi:3-deoxy-D-manno-octulosonic-acid transferase